MKLTITKIFTNEVNTKDGIKETYRVMFKEKSNVYVSAWKGNWNKDWKIDDVLEVDPKQIVKNTGKDGKTYFNLKAPEGARGGFGEIVKRIDALEKRIVELENKDFTKDDQEPLETENFIEEETQGVKEEDINLEEVPF